MWIQRAGIVFSWSGQSQTGQQRLRLTTGNLKTHGDMDGVRTDSSEPTETLPITQMDTVDYVQEV